MRIRLLNPFVAALLGSTLLVLTMLAWSGLRNETLLEPTGVQADTSSATDNDEVLTATLEVTPTMVYLGEEVPFSLPVELTDTNGISVAWDFDIGTIIPEVITPTDDLTTTLIGVPGVLDGTPTAASSRADGPGFTYSQDGSYDISAAVAAFTDTWVMTPYASVDVPAISVDVEPQELDLTASNLTPEVGDTVQHTITIQGYNDTAVEGVGLIITNTTTSETVAQVSVTEPDFTFEVSGDTATVTPTIDLPIASTDELYVMATISTTADFTYTQAVTDALTIRPQETPEPIEVTLDADNTSVLIEESVNFTVDVEQDNTDITDDVLTYTLDYGDGTVEEFTNATIVNATHAYTPEGTYTAIVTVTLTDEYEGVPGDRFDELDIEVTQPEPGLTVAPGKPIIQASPDNPETTVIRAILNDELLNPLPGEDVTLTIESPTYGGRFVATASGPLSPTVKTISGQTNDNGVFTATLQAASLAGIVDITAESDDLEDTTQVTFSTADTGAQQAEITVSATVSDTATFDFGLGLTGEIVVPEGVLTGTFYLVVTPREIGPEAAATTNDGKQVVLPFVVELFWAEGDMEGEKVDVLPDALDGAGVEVTLNIPAVLLSGVLSDTLALYDSTDTTLPIGDYTLVDDPISLTFSPAGASLTTEIDQLGEHAVAATPEGVQPGPPEIYLPVIRKP